METLTINDFIPLENEIKAMVTHLGSKSPEDSVQEVYMKLLNIQDKEGNLDRIEYKGKPNKSYLYLIARSVVVTEHREAAKDVKRGEAFLQSLDSAEDMEYILEREEMLDRFIKEFEDMHFFSKKVFSAYVLDNHSINSLSEATLIGKQTIRNEIKYVKEKIRSSQEEYKNS
tara:strand:+ start:1324 stop:1839 length:516 start_codon:yes stop_codon:yes gene_type:complete